MMMNIEKLVARLRERQERIHDLSGVSYIDDPDCQKAADKLEELSAQVERCHEWLEARDAIIKGQDEELFALRKWRQEYVGKLTIAEAALAEMKRENEALRKLVDSAESIFINCSVTDGVCCCGDDMETHPSPMFCGHTPVDHGAYQVDLWLKARNAGGTDVG